MILGGIVSLALVLAALFGPEGVTRHEQLRDELDQIQFLSSNLRRENKLLMRQSQALRSNPEYIEAVIRDELGWVHKEELVYIFGDDTAEGP